MTAVELQGISKHFGDTVALGAIDLQIGAGELFFLLGPSGCGKSTLLRLIAGLHEPSSGHILFSGRDVTRLRTESRNAVMCFQSYALWPHMSVRDNVRFGLEVRKLPAKETTARIDEVLKLVQMKKFAHRRPSELSGGQQQRVALARALAVRPDCLLLDEPLSNLDATLRLEMRAEIRRICKTSGSTTIYVTHDQKEALSVADRIAVMRDGRVVQVGSPVDLYQRPMNSFVAAFLGQTNLIEGQVSDVSPGDALCLDTLLGPIISTAARGRQPLAVGAKVVLSIRPERVRISADAVRGDGPNRFKAERAQDTFLGESSEHVVRVGQQTLTIVSAPPVSLEDREVSVEVDPADVIILPE